MLAQQREENPQQVKRIYNFPSFLHLYSICYLLFYLIVDYLAKHWYKSDALTIEENDEDDETTEQKEDTSQQVMILLQDVSNNLEFCILHS